MVCEHCGNIVRDGATVCDQCGAELTPIRHQQGAAGRRQGRPEKPESQRGGSAMLPENTPLMPDAVLTSQRRPRAEAPGRPSARRGTPPPPTTGKKMGRPKKEKARSSRRMMVNWALLWTITAIVLLILAGAGAIFMKKSDTGQLILARMGKEANAKALWTYGQELLDQGYVERSIEIYEKAYQQEPEAEDIYQRLQQLADAYEADGRAADAERVYTEMYERVDEKNPLAYWNVVRLMEAQDRKMEMASFLKMAHEKTGDESFRRQREELLPAVPTTDQEAGSLMRERDIHLKSEEDYEIYYLFGEEGALPEDGTLYEGSIHLSEGTHILRAVAVSSDLVSDELNVQYTIHLPVPLAPYASLAPGPYEHRQRIWLKYQEAEDQRHIDDPKQKDITIYYTLDSQNPTSNSPIYTGEPFYLPGGKVILKAVAVNGYGKVSNVMQRDYEIKQPFKRFFNEKDEFKKFTIMKTDLAAFKKSFGEPLEEQKIEDPTVRGYAVKLNYTWGEARFVTVEDGSQVLYFIESDQSELIGPRSTRRGQTEKEITEKYRDMGQTYDQNGDRSIYYDEKAGYGKLFHLDDDHDRIDYVRYRTDGSTVTLSYMLNKGVVEKMSMRCAYPQK